MANTLKFGNGEWYGKKNTILAYNDENKNYKPLPFDFSRGSSATVANKDGLIETVGSGQPRIDYKDDSNGALLLEPQRTNLLPYSEDFSQSYWYKSGSYTITSNYGISPDGTNNSTRIQGDASVVIYRNVSSATDSRSIYVKATSGSGNVQLLSHNNNTNNIFAIDENWKRVEINSASVLPDNFYLVDFRGASTDVFDIEIWGAQAEASSYATSYIPTQGSTSTRLGETAVDAGNANVFNSEEGVLYAEIAALADDGVDKGLSINNGASNRIWVGYSTASTRIYAIGYTNNTLQFVMFKNLPTDTNIVKVAVKYKENDFALWVNGIKEATNTSGLTPIGLNSVDFDITGSGVASFYGKTKNIQVFTEALSDEELQKLTTI